MSWKAKIDSAVASREDLKFETLLDQFDLPFDVDAQAVQGALAIFEQEYGVPVGKLRPDDDLELFITPPPTGNPMSWLFGRAAVEDRASELSFALKKARKQLGLAPIPSTPPKTVRDYVLAWLGLT